MTLFFETYPVVVVLVPLGIAVLLLGICCASLHVSLIRNKEVKKIFGSEGVPSWYKIFGRCMGKQEWDFSGSWVTTATTFGTFLTAIITAKIITDSASPNTTPTVYSVVSLFFGLLVILAPIFYRATAKYVIPDHHQTDETPPPEPQGYVKYYFVASLFVLWAAFGELETAAAMVISLDNKLFPIKAFSLFFLGFTFLSICFYALQAIPWTVLDQITTAHQKKTKAPPIERPSLHSWKLL